MALLTMALLTMALTYYGSTYYGSTIQDPAKLLTEYEATQAELGSTRLLVRQLEQQLAGRATEVA